MADTMGERLRLSRERAGLYQERLAEMIGVTSGRVISNWEKNIARPDADKMVRLCRALDISPSFLLGYIDGDEYLEPDEQETLKKYRELDEHGREIVNMLLDKEYNRVTAGRGGETRRYKRVPFFNSAASAGTGLYLSDVESETIRVPLNRTTIETDYVIPIRGDSMEPEFSDRDRVCVKVQPTVNVGEIGVFLINGDAYVKKYEENRLVSLNPKYNDIIIGKFDSIFCKGKVLGKLDTRDFTL